MPKFVPVMDTEKPLSEQQGDQSSLAKHRRYASSDFYHVQMNKDYFLFYRFDNPYSLADSTGHKKVDRGWQQGNRIMCTALSNCRNECKIFLEAMLAGVSSALSVVMEKMKWLK